MHKKKVGNHMEDYLCVGVLLCQWQCRIWPWEYTNHALYPLLSRTCNRNKFKNLSKEGLISYYKTNGITFLRNHVDANHIIIAKMFEKEVNSLLKGREERQLKVIIFGGSIFKFFSIKNSFKKEDVSWKEFLEDLGLSIVKNNLPIQFVESMWLKCLILRLCPN